MTRTRTRPRPAHLGPRQHALVTALRSSDFPPEQGCLRSERGFCVLGIAEHLRNPHRWVRLRANPTSWKSNPPRWEYACGATHAGPGTQVRLTPTTMRAYRAHDRHMRINLNAIDDRALYIELFAHSIEIDSATLDFPNVARLTDRGYSFRRLADLMETHPRAFFRRPA